LGLEARRNVASTTVGSGSVIARTQARCWCRLPAGLSDINHILIASHLIDVVVVVVVVRPNSVIFGALPTSAAQWRVERLNRNKSLTGVCVLPPAPCVNINK